MKSLGSGAVLGFLLLASGCAPASNTTPKDPANVGAFVYAPALNPPHRETMQRYEEMSTPNTPMRNAER